MPRVWSWYQLVEARSTFGYWKTANPCPQRAPNFLAAFFLKNFYQVPWVAKAGGMSLAAGRYQASA